MPTSITLFVTTFGNIMTEKTTPSNPNNAQNQRSFLVRVSATNSGQTHWRITVQDLQTHQQHHLPDLGDLTQFLQKKTATHRCDHAGVPNSL
jgi:hypothetical protein